MEQKRRGRSTLPSDAALLEINLGGEMVHPVVDRPVADGVPVVLATGYNERDVLARLHHLSRLERPLEPRQVIRAPGGP